jgi:hypothetical protein
MYNEEIMYQTMKTGRGVGCTIFPTTRHYNAGISELSIVVNVGWPRPFAPRGQSELKIVSPLMIAVRLCAALLGSGWRERVVEHWFGCSHRP